MDEGESRGYNNKERIYKISAIPSAKTLYSASIEDLAIVCCFLDFQEIRVDPRYTRIFDYQYCQPNQH